MVAELLEYKMKKHLARIDRLVAELVIIRRYIYSAKVGLTYCRRHVARGGAAVSLSSPVGNEFVKNQELLLLGLREAEKRVKKQLAEASRELALVCSCDRALRGLNSSSN